MLKSFTVQGFKSLTEVGSIEMAPLTVFFGPNAAGKSNLLDAILLLSRLATARTVAEALEGPVRGLPLELFSFPEREGLPGLLAKSTPGAVDALATLAPFDDPDRLSPAAHDRDRRGCLRRPLGALTATAGREPRWKSWTTRRRCRAIPSCWASFSSWPRVWTPT